MERRERIMATVWQPITFLAVFVCRCLLSRATGATRRFSKRRIADSCDSYSQYTYSKRTISLLTDTPARLRCRPPRLGLRLLSRIVCSLKWDRMVRLACGGQIYRGSPSTPPPLPPARKITQTWPHICQTCFVTNRKEKSKALFDIIWCITPHQTQPTQLSRK